jgi:lipopolysaccharide export system protein LptC
MVQRFWKGMAATLALAVPLLAAPGCRAAKPGEGREVVPELKLDGVRFRVYRGDTLRAFGEAKTTSLRRDSTELSARDLVATLPDAATAVRITAPTGQGVASSRVFSASGGITVSRGDDVARTERARFEPSRTGGLVVGEAPVAVEGRGYRLTGPGFTLDPATGDITVRGGVRALAGLQPAEAAPNSRSSQRAQGQPDEAAPERAGGVGERRLPSRSEAQQRGAEHSPTSKELR